MAQHTKEAILLDTIALSWLALRKSNIPMSEVIEAKVYTSMVYISEVSLFEFAIQVYSGKLVLDVPVDTWIYSIVGKLSAVFLEISGLDYRALSELPKPIHKKKEHTDPFDRMLVAQASNSGLAIISCDTVFSKYGIQSYW